MNEERAAEGSDRSSFRIRRSSFSGRRLALAVALSMAALALLPQVSLWRARGAGWNGEYAQAYSDEPFYAAYANALGSGRPRRNDPYSGRDDSGESPLPESILSVQFAAGYAVALPARLLGLSTATVFILLPPVVAFLSSLAVFWLVRLATGDEWVAAAAVPFVLCLGVLVNFQGAIRTLTGTPPIYTYLPFLRRYLPAAPFPVFLAFFACAWRALEAQGRRASRLWALAAGGAVALLVYSYFYLWTAALAWLACLAFVGALARRGGGGVDPRRRDSEVFAITFAVSLAALVPYFGLLSRRAADTDAVQALARTHAPDLLRRPELVGFALVAALTVAVWRGRVQLRERAAQFAAAFALMPFAVYNQQLLTGRSLQPLHYDTYAANYSVLLASVLLAWLVLAGRRGGRAGAPPSKAGASSSKKARLLLACAALASFGWGVVESKLEIDRLSALNRGRDEARAAALRVAELAGADFRSNGGARPVVLWADLAHANELPGAAADAAVLWAMHMYSYPGVTLAENKRRFFAHLYYTGVHPARFAAMAENDLRFRHQLFGWERINRRLNVAGFRPVGAEEARAEGAAYAAFVSAFSREHAGAPAISYVVARAESPPDLSNLERWYEREAIERAGGFVIYRVKLKAQ